MKTVRIRYQYDEADKTMINAIFAGIFRSEALTDAAQEKERIDNLSRFTAQFADNIFQDEYAILYELAATRRLTTGTWDTMEPVINENKELILNAPQVNLSQYKSDFTESDSYDAFILITKMLYEDICDTPFPGAEGFRSAVNSFIEVFEKKYTRQCLAVTSAILNSPVPYTDYRGGRRREYQGYKGAMEFIANEKMKIDSLRASQLARQFVLDSEWLYEQIDPDIQKERAKRTELLCTLGIPEIDDTWSGLRRSRFIGIIGPPKGGKTTLAAYMAHRLLREGRRVAIWAMEGSAHESWIDKLIAAHCVVAHGLKISTKDLRDGIAGLTDEQRIKVSSARASLIQEERLSFIEETGYVEDFLEVIDGHYRVFNKFDALIIDSPVNLQTRTGRKKTEYLSAAYMQLKNYIEHKFDVPPVCIATAQFKQDAIKEARNSVDPIFDETSGGETAETIRTPDEVIGIFATQAQRNTNRTTLQHIATRHSEQFRTLEVRVSFGQALFRSI